MEQGQKKSNVCNSRFFHSQAHGPKKDPKFFTRKVEPTIYKRLRRQSNKCYELCGKKRSADVGFNLSIIHTKDPTLSAQKLCNT